MWTPCPVHLTSPLGLSCDHPLSQNTQHLSSNSILVHMLDATHSPDLECSDPSLRQDSRSRKWPERGFLKGGSFASIHGHQDPPGLCFSCGLMQVQVKPVKSQSLTSLLSFPWALAACVGLRFASPRCPKPQSPSSRL